MTERPPGLAPATVVVAAGRPDRAPGAPVNVPIELSSTYAAHPTLGADGVATNLGYGRASNSTWEAFEAAVGALEGGQALCFASGMAAISAALAVLPADGALVAPRTPYNTSGALIGEVEAAGREVRRVDVQDTAAVVAALDGAGAIWLESPTNPLMEVGATSLGGVESLIERRRRYPGESPLVPDTLLRLSVGIEDVEDLWRDLEQALG